MPGKLAPHNRRFGDEPTERNLTILVIDDLEEVVRVLAHYLDSCGHTVLTASSGPRGLQIFKQNHVDLVLCDLGMPGMDGWEVGKAIKAACHQTEVPKTPFVLVTAWSEQIRGDGRISRAGVDAVIGKPVEFTELSSVIEKTMRQRHPTPSTLGPK